MSGRPRQIAAALAGALAVAGLSLWWLWPVPGPDGSNKGVGSEQGIGPLDPRPMAVVIYLIDTLRADRLGAYGYGKPTSPRIDGLAKESVLFEHAYAVAPWTLPSVVSLMTSRYPCEHGVIAAGHQLPPSFPTLAEQLRGLGFTTAAIYQNDYATMGGLQRGYQSTRFRKELETLDVDTATFLDGTGGQPFFLYLHSMEPHATHYAPMQDIQRFGFVSVDDRETYRAHWEVWHKLYYLDSKQERVPGTTDTTAGLRQALGNLHQLRAQEHILYDAAVAFADDELGQTIDVLKQRGVWDRTLFILMADHGEELEDHGLWFHDQSVYEELIHVPLLVHFPRGEFGGKRIGARVSLLDVMPTILEVQGRPGLCKDCRGSSLLPLARADGTGRYVSAQVPSIRINRSGYFKPLRQSRGDTNVVVRDQQWKGIWNKDTGNVELYDLATDPGEKTDLSARFPARARDLQQRASAWLAACQPAADTPPRQSLDEQTRERLKAVGYF